MSVLVQRILLTVIGLAVGGALCVYVFAQAEVGAADWLALLSSYSLPACLVVLLLTHALMVSGARKWAILSQAMHGEAGQEPTSAFFLRHYLWQNWIGQFVPPSLAIILGRGFAARTMPGVRVLSGLWNGILDQALEFALLLSFIGGSVLVLWFGGGVLAFLLGSAGGVAALALVAFIGQRWIPETLRAALWPLFGWSFVRAALTVLRLVVGVQALGLFLSGLKVAALAPVVSILALIPLTPGNLGIAEWGWQSGLVWVGEGVIAATLYAAAFRVLILIAQTLLLGLNEAYVYFSKK